MNPLRYPLMSFIFLVILTTHFVSVTPQNQFTCSKNGNYTSGSLYRANLNFLLHSLSSNIDNSGFYHTSVGRVNAIVLCRGDIQPQECRLCIDTAAVKILEVCPYQMQAILWSESCTLRYSDKPIFGILETSPGFVERTTINNVTSDVAEFIRAQVKLIDDLLGKAANGSEQQKVAADNAAVGHSTIYAMVQCTPDLSVEDCKTCLVRATYAVTSDFDAAGLRVLMPSCNTRYEIYPFFNSTRLPSLTSSGNTNENTTRNTIMTTQNIITIVISTVMGLILALSVGIFAIKKLKQNTMKNPNVHEISTVESIQYDFGQIRAATNDFSEGNKLGRGGFGIVYKGKLIDGREIAVKRLSENSGQGDVEFKNEVLLVARLQHRNLVKLLGFSMEGSERLLVYEFQENGSLNHFIFDPIKSSNLSWEMRYKIIGGIARGLLYLHEDSRLRIIHRDLKASNVLLDEDMNPKISDFGMAKLIMSNVNQGSSTKIVGTYGYIAPEYVLHGQFSIKSDVYSFGVLVLEMISGKKKVNFPNGENSKDLLSSVWRSWHEGSSANLIDPTLRASSSNQLDILRCIHIALLCVQEHADNRPTMASVVLMLNSFSLTLPTPLKPAFYVPSNSLEDAPLPHESSSSSKGRLALYTELSNKDFSITELYPR